MSENRGDLLQQMVFEGGSRPGQTAASEEKYRNAILTCMRVDCLHLSLAEIARRFNLAPANLRSQLRRNFPEIIPQRTACQQIYGIRPEKARTGKVLCRDGSIVQGTPEEIIGPIAAYISSHPSKSTGHVAARFNVPERYISRNMLKYHPDIWERHKRECAKKKKR